MARDEGLEELIREDLAAEPGLREKAMFGGRAWLLNGNLVCGAREDGMLMRLGKEDFMELVLDEVRRNRGQGPAISPWCPIMRFRHETRAQPASRSIAR